MNFNILRTPLVPYYGGLPDAELQIYLKPENLQIFGSYKIRGIASVVANADPVLLRQGLSAASAGNMAQAVAYAALHLAKSNIHKKIVCILSGGNISEDFIQTLFERCNQRLRRP